MVVFLKEWGSLFVCVEEKLFLYGKCVCMNSLVLYNLKGFRLLKK